MENTYLFMVISFQWRETTHLQYQKQYLSYSLQANTKPPFSSIVTRFTIRSVTEHLSVMMMMMTMMTVRIIETLNYYNW